jgi:N6-adenosine-specific RNA methylase IME4
MEDFFGVKGEKFDIILADPPWHYTHCTTMGSTDKHYKSMTDSEMKKLPVHQLCNDNCALLLWTTGPQLHKALSLMEAWGFEYKTIQHVWVKQQKDSDKIITNGLSWYTRPATELVLVGLRGNLMKLKGAQKDGACKVPQLIMASRREHSRKPDEIFALVDQFFDKKTKKIELFARTKREGWTSWGNETDKFVHT